MNRKKINDVGEWDFEIDEKSILELDTHSKKFLTRVRESQIQKKTFDYSLKISYEQCCDDLKTFLIDTTNRFTNFGEKNKNTPGEFGNKQKIFCKLQETKKHLKPLVELCQDYKLNREILKYLYHSTHFAIERDYVKATDYYMQVNHF